MQKAIKPDILVTGNQNNYPWITFDDAKNDQVRKRDE